MTPQELEAAITEIREVLQNYNIRIHNLIHRVVELEKKVEGLVENSNPLGFRFNR